MKYEIEILDDSVFQDILTLQSMPYSIGSIGDLFELKHGESAVMGAVRDVKLADGERYVFFYNLEKVFRSPCNSYIFMLDRVLMLPGKLPNPVGVQLLNGLINQGCGIFIYDPTSRLSRQDLVAWLQHNTGMVLEMLNTPGVIRRLPEGVIYTKALEWFKRLPASKKAGIRGVFEGNPKMVKSWRDEGLSVVFFDNL